MRRDLHATPRLTPFRTLIVFDWVDVFQLILVLMNNQIQIQSSAPLLNNQKWKQIQSSTPIKKQTAPKCFFFLFVIMSFQISLRSLWLQIIGSYHKWTSIAPKVLAAFEFNLGIDETFHIPLPECHNLSGLYYVVLTNF